MDDQGFDAQVIQRRIVVVIDGIQMDVAKNSPKGPHIGAYPFEADSRPAFTDKFHRCLALLSHFADPLQQHIDPGCMFHWALLFIADMSNSIIFV